MNRRSRRLVVALAGLVAVGCGGATRPATARGPAAKTIEIEMADNAFHPAEITVSRGERVTLRFTNKGAVPHEAFVGDAAAQAEHEAEMSGGSMEEMGHHGHAMPGDDSSSVTLEPGRSATITHVFDRGGRTEIACHEAGHYGSGMKIAVTVT
jgi:uncharacterized cupredoxin-like copper-binding protein